MHGSKHWTTKGGVRLFLWRKASPGGAAAAGTVFFVHGSSMASQPTFGLQAPELSFRSAGVEAQALAPRELAAFMRAEHDKRGKVVRATGATAILPADRLVRTRRPFFGCPRCPGPAC